MSLPRAGEAGIAADAASDPEREAWRSLSKAEGADGFGEMFALLFGAQTPAARAQPQPEPEGEMTELGQPKAADIALLVSRGSGAGVKAQAAGAAVVIQTADVDIPDPTQSCHAAIVLPETEPGVLPDDIPPPMPGPPPDQTGSRPHAMPIQGAMAAAAVSAPIGGQANVLPQQISDPAPRSERKEGKERLTAIDDVSLRAATSATSAAANGPVHAPPFAQGNWQPFDNRRAAQHQQSGRDSTEVPVAGIVEFRPGMTRADVTPALPAEAQGRQVAQTISGQIAAAISSGPDGQIDIALEPAELGRVRIGLQASDGAISLSIMAERPETADLMRRHLDQLIGDFRALGYTEVTFTFGDQSGTPGDKDTSARASVGDTDLAAPDPADISNALTAQRARSGGLDIRL